MIEYLPSSDGTLKVTKTADGFSLSVQSGSVPAGAFSDSLTLTSRRQLFDWNDGDTLTHWQNYRFHRRQPLVLERLLLHRASRILPER